MKRTVLMLKFTVLTPLTYKINLWLFVIVQSLKKFCPLTEDR